MANRFDTAGTWADDLGGRAGAAGGDGLGAQNVSGHHADCQERGQSRLS